MNRCKQAMANHAKALVAVLLCVPLSVIAFFNDLEKVQQQLFTAGEIMLALDVSDDNILVGVGESGIDAREVQIILSEKSSSAQYEVVVIDASGDDEFCNQLQLKSDFGSIVTIGSLKNFAVGPHTTTGVWKFGVLPSLFLDEEVPHGATCTATIEVEAWQKEMSKSTGYHHRETFTLVFESNQIVLNEVLAQPDTNAPEFIELYNNGSEDVDVAGWIIEEWTSSGATTSHTVASLGEPKSNLIAYDGSGSTVVPAGGFLALRFASNQQYLNNNGDTITLYDAAGRQLDTYTYEKAKVKMSDARVPDGTGDWVDPIPTPGFPNLAENATLKDLSVNLVSSDGDGELVQSPTVHTEEITDETDGEASQTTLSDLEKSVDTSEDQTEKLVEGVGEEILSEMEEAQSLDVANEQHEESMEEVLEPEPEPEPEPSKSEEEPEPEPVNDSV